MIKKIPDRFLMTVVLILAIILGLSGCASAPAQPPQSAIKVVPAKVTKGVDGDTVHVSLNGKDETVRFIGVNAPELSHPAQNIQEQPYGQEAAKHMTDALLGKTVYLEFDVGQRDKYGRLLAYIWLAPPKDNSENEIRGKMFNAQLLLNGYAQVMTVPPDVKYSDLFLKFQREAQSNNKGLWAGGEKPNDRYDHIG